MFASGTLRYTIGAALFFAACACLAIGVLYFTRAQGVKLEEQMEVVNTKRILENTYNDLVQTLKATEVEHKELAGYFLTETQTIQFLSEIESIARNLGLSIVTDSLEVQPLPKENFETILLRLRVQGDKETLLGFIKILENVPYFSHVKELELQQQAGVWSANVKLMVGLQAYDK